MKNVIYSFLSGFVCCMVVCITIYYTDRKPKPKEPPVYVQSCGETIQTVIRYPDDLSAAASAPIVINRRIEYPYLFISASDGYKKAEVKDTMAIGKPEPDKNFLFCGAGIGWHGLPFYTVNVGYMRRLWGPVFVGGSAAYYPGGIGVSVNAGVSF